MLLPHFVPCQQDVISVRIFACTIAVGAYPTTKMLARFRCAGALRCDGRRASNRFARASFTRAANRPVRVAAQPLQLSVYGRRSMESLRALHQYTSVQRRLALHTAPATLVARPAPVESLHSWSHCEWFEERERRNLCPLTALRLQLGLRRSNFCACLHASAMKYARKPSQRLGQHLYDALRRSKLFKVRGPPVPLSDRFVQSTQIAARLLRT